MMTLHRMRLVYSIVKKAVTTGSGCEAVTRSTPVPFSWIVGTRRRPTTTSVRHLSAFQGTCALAAQVTLQSLQSLVNEAEGNLLDADNTNDASDGDGATVRQLLPIGSAVREGDVIALVRKHNKHDDMEEDFPILAPGPGRITQWYATPSQYVKIGEPILELDNETLLQDVQAWKNYLQQCNHQDSSSKDSNFLHPYLELDDIFRLQHLLQAIREETGAVQTGNIVLSTCIQLYQRIVELQDFDPRAQSQTCTEWGVMLHQHQDLHGALQQFLIALQKRQEAYPSHHPHIVASHFHVGAIYRQLGNIQQALEHIQTALTLQIQDLGHSTHPRIAAGYNTIGTIHLQMRNYHDAKTNYEMALNILEELQASSSNHKEFDDDDVAGTHHNLGVAFKYLQDFDFAKQHLQVALTIRKRLQQRPQPHASLENTMTATANVAASHYALGQLWADMGNFPMALSEFQSALDLHEQVYGTESPMTAEGYNTIGSIHFQMQELDSALQAHRKALTILQQIAPDHEDLAATYNNVGLTLHHLQKYPESLDHYRLSRQILEEIYGKDHPILAKTIGSIGNTLHALMQYHGAMVEFQTAHALLEQALGSDHPEIAKSFNNMGLLWSQQGQHEQAVHSYESAADIFTKTLGTNHPHTASCHFNIGLAWKSQGQFDSAKKEFQKAREIWNYALGPDHPNLAMVEQCIQECQS